MLNPCSFESGELPGRSIPHENKKRTCGRGSLSAKNLHEFTGSVRETSAAARNEIDMARDIELADFHFLHPAVLDFPLDTHARNEGHAHAHLNEALHAFDGGHFDGHIERGAVSRKQLNDAEAEGRFNAVRDKSFFAKLGDIDFTLLRKEMLGVHDQSQLILQDLRGLKLGIAGHVRYRAEIQAVVQDLMRNVPR